MLELFQLPLRAQDLRMIIGITERLEGNQRIEHRRKDRCQAIGSLEPLQHPLLGFSQRAIAEWMDAIFSKPFGEFMDPVEPKKKIPPGKALRVARRRQIALMDAFRVQLIEVDALFKQARRFELNNNCQGYQHGTASRTYVG